MKAITRVREILQYENWKGRRKMKMGSRISIELQNLTYKYHKHHTRVLRLK